MGATRPSDGPKGERLGKTLELTPQPLVVRCPGEYFIVGNLMPGGGLQLPAGLYVAPETY